MYALEKAHIFKHGSNQAFTLSSSENPTLYIMKETGILIHVFRNVDCLFMNRDMLSPLSPLF